ncbi:fasciclin domain-containing protein [Sneathiella limimaris]|uniref:fasciclin domain-containing protein n=1 Tax=Sneathiella limimaris TaxID=1964213 RepID=UPI00146B822C|nr:fasciclin domain-containing protein [Sneathiella limimaris]
MKLLKQAVLPVAAVSMLALGACTAVADNPEVGGAPMYESKTIVENAMNSDDHTTLVAAVKAAGLVDTLQGDGPYTVFAPTNAAFAKLPEGTVENLLKPENKETLTKILTCHVLAAKALSDPIKQMVDNDGGTLAVKTVGGCQFTAMYDKDKIMIKDGQGNIANVTIEDVKQSNGVIHVIDTVLLPSS